MLWRIDKVWKSAAATAVLTVTMPALAAPPRDHVPGVTCGGDPPRAYLNPTSRDACVSPALQQYVAEQCAINRKRLGLGVSSSNEGGTAGGPPLPLYPFFPMAGNLDHGDVANYQTVDLDPAVGVSLDYLCRTYLNDGHGGADYTIPTFAHQTIGVPVFAARDGTVIFAQDGWPDMNLFGGVQGNIIIIDHGDTIESQYYHLKNGSVAVSVGQQVKAGQQIAAVASSGNSYDPHLHFQTMINGQVYEPFTGPCHPGTSGWGDQAMLDTDDVFLNDFGITKSDLNALPEPWWHPWPIPCDSQFSTADSNVNFYWLVYNLPIDCPFSIKFFRPDSSQAWDYTWHWGNTEVYRRIKTWFSFDFQLMGPVPGTWRIEFTLNGQLMINAPFEVVAGPADPNFNRPPEPISVAFDPPAPTINDVVFCRVSTQTAKEDLDWDIVRYRYVWEVNGNIVRDVVNAAQSDAIPHHVACGGSTLICTVTPNDGTVDGPSAIASVMVSGPHGPDITCDGVVNVSDLLAVITNWGPCAVPLLACAADVNGDGVVNVTDLLAVITNWG